MNIEPVGRASAKTGNKTGNATGPTSRLPFFYGWVVVAVTFVTMAIGVNARTSFSLFYPPILSEFGWDRGVTAGAFSFPMAIRPRAPRSPGCPETL